MLTMLNIPEFKIRCSAIGQIMTDSKGKTKAEKVAELESCIEVEKAKYAAMTNKTTKTAENKAIKINSLIKELDELKTQPEKVELSQTCKTYLEKWLKEKLYGVKYDFTSKQTYKGNAVEDDAIEYANTHLWGQFDVKKNTERKQDEFSEGECDVEFGDWIIDVKSSFSPETFPLFADKCPNPDYEYQVQRYMHLWEKKKGSIVFVLMPMPIEIIESQAHQKARYTYSPDSINYDDKYNDIFQRLCEENDRILDPQKVPHKYRLVSFNIEYDAELNKAIEKRVLECREYIKTVLLPKLA